MSSLTLGPYLRLEGLSTSQLPSTPHAPDIGSPISPPLSKFISDVLHEALPFIDLCSPKSPTPTSWKKKGSPRKFSTSSAPVDVLEYVVSGKDISKVQGLSALSKDKKRDETWYARKSVHVNEASKGTASWEEFVYAFKEHHHQSEDAFTPSVIGAREAVRWDVPTDLVVEAGGAAGSSETWTDISMCIVEMTHAITPKPLKDRTFPVLQLCASLAKEEEKEFVVVSIPLTDFNKSEKAVFAKDEALVMAAYVSVERIRILPPKKDKDGKEEEGTKEQIEWIMATASDAGGVLPQWMQNMAVPGKVAKDVELFMGWIGRERKSLPIVGAGKANGENGGKESTGKSLPKAPDEGGEGMKMGEKGELAGGEGSDKALPAAPVAA